MAKSTIGDLIVALDALDPSLAVDMDYLGIVGVRPDGFVQHVTLEDGVFRTQAGAADPSLVPYGDSCDGCPHWSAHGRGARCHLLDLSTEPGERFDWLADRTKVCGWNWDAAGRVAAPDTDPAAPSQAGSPN